MTPKAHLRHKMQRLTDAVTCLLLVAFTVGIWGLVFWGCWQVIKR
jgi:hypothetical protein